VILLVSKPPPPRSELDELLSPAVSSTSWVKGIISPDLIWSAAVSALILVICYSYVELELELLLLDELELEFTLLVDEELLVVLKWAVDEDVSELSLLELEPLLELLLSSSQLYKGARIQVFGEKQ
jgi:hypothetical protein